MPLGDRWGSVVIVVVGFPGLVLTNSVCKLALQCKTAFVGTTAAEADFADSRQRCRKQEAVVQSHPCLF